MKKKIIIYSQHLQGIGHFIRAWCIACALKKHDVIFVNGGLLPENIPLDGDIKLIQVPAISANIDFSDYHYSHDPSIKLNDIIDFRRIKLLDIVNREKPDIFITEMFPFGRRKFRSELIPCIEYLKRHHCKIICSLRDILIQRKNQQEFDNTVVETINRFYDAILIHSDPRWHRFSNSFTAENDLKCDIAYTGYVTPHAKFQGANRIHDKIVVSMGNRETNQHIIETILKLCITYNVDWKFEFFLGRHQISDSIIRLIAENRNIHYNCFTHDFFSSLKNASLSINLGGYNTILDVLQSGVRSLAIPHPGDDEQYKRCMKLADSGRIFTLPYHMVTENTLYETIQTAMKTTPSIIDIDTEGARKTAELIDDI